MIAVFSVIAGRVSGHLQGASGWLLGAGVMAVVVAVVVVVVLVVVVGGVGGRKPLATRSTTAVP
ncbi:hypothetical protein [Streptomyces sp. NPDC017260]|uniref:hypothetical protein n=1 Tax=unclassified Streptomyces TaxID=2593676 RepID=UPI00378A273F